MRQAVWTALGDTVVHLRAGRRRVTLCGQRVEVYGNLLPAGRDDWPHVTFCEDCLAADRAGTTTASSGGRLAAPSTPVTGPPKPTATSAHKATPLPLSLDGLAEALAVVDDAVAEQGSAELASTLLDLRALLEAYTGALNADDTSVGSDSVSKVDQHNADSPPHMTNESGLIRDGIAVAKWNHEYGAILGRATAAHTRLAAAVTAATNGPDARTFDRLRRAGRYLASVAQEALATPLTGVESIDGPRRRAFELYQEAGTVTSGARIAPSGATHPDVRRAAKLLSDGTETLAHATAATTDLTRRLVSLVEDRGRT